MRAGRQLKIEAIHLIGSKCPAIWARAILIERRFDLAVPMHLQWCAGRIQKRSREAIPLDGVEPQPFVSSHDAEYFGGLAFDFKGS